MEYWSRQIFNYCERMLNGAFWAEPLNALTNIAFWLAAIAAFILWLRTPGTERRIFDLLLIILVAIIGTGSFLFHTFATRWSILADTTPIGLFIWALRRWKPEQVESPAFRMAPQVREQEP